MELLDVCHHCVLNTLCRIIKPFGSSSLKIVAVVCLLSYCHAQAAPEEDLMTVAYTITSQGDAELTCSVPNIGRRRLIWRRMADPLPISVGNTRFFPDSKFQVKTVDGDAIRLTIRSVSLGYAGEYMCTTSGEGPVSRILTLEIPADAGKTYLLPSDTDLAADLGDDVTMPCHVEDLGSRLVMWKKSNDEIVSLRKKIYNGDRRFEVVHDTRTEWSLRLRDVKLSDFGTYTCIVNSRPVLTRTVTLRNSAPVQSAPVLKRDSDYKVKIEADHGDTVTLTCNFRANPPAKVTWYRTEKVNGKLQYTEVGRGNSVTLEGVLHSQSGKYVCKARNGLSPNGRGRTKLTVKAPPSTIPPSTQPTTFIPDSPAGPVMYHHERRIGQRRGKNGELSCTSIGWPRPAMYWRHKGHRITANHKYHVTESNSGRYQKTSTLLVRSLSRRDFGEYQCVGRNNLGLTELEVTLYDNSR